MTAVCNSEMKTQKCYDSIGSVPNLLTCQVQVPHFVNLPKTLVKELGPQRIAHSKFKLQLWNSNWGTIGSAIPYLISFLLPVISVIFFKDVDAWTQYFFDCSIPEACFGSNHFLLSRYNSERGVMSGESQSNPLPKAEAKPKARVRRPHSDWTEGGISMNSLMYKIYTCYDMT